MPRTRSTSEQKQSAITRRTRTKEYYCFHRARWRHERLYGLTKAVRWMERYALIRLEKSGGAPVSLNQSAIAATARIICKKKDGTRIRCTGPALRTIQRSWRVFMKYMNGLGYKFVRAHSKGVAKNGKRPPRKSKRSKLGWVIYSKKWEDDGNQILRYIARPESASGSKLRSRWVRDECLQLVAEKEAIEAIHSAKLTAKALPSGEQTKIFEHHTPRFADPASESELHLSIAFRKKYRPWKLNYGAMRKIWAIARKYLHADADPVAHRAIDLWRAGFPGSRLFAILERAVGWANEARSGHVGKIAAGAFAGLLMGSLDPFRHPPSSEEFWLWMHENVETWRMKTARRIKDAVAAAAKAPDGDKPITLEEVQQTLANAERLGIPSAISLTKEWAARVIARSTQA